LNGDLYRIEINATIDAGYHMYDFGPYETGGPNATSITFGKGIGYELVDSVRMEDSPVRVYDDVYKMDIGYFEGSAKFSQDIRLHAKEANVMFNVEWMSCNDNSCVPPDDVDITVDVKAAAGKGTWTKAAGSSDNGTIKAMPDANASAKGGSLWALVLEAIIWGFAALLTPCVFPMVPMTVSYFIKGDGDSGMGKFRAAMYGLFIVLLYTLPIAIIIILTRIIGGEAITANIFNWLATNWIPNIIFFIVFMVFAASFFGAFEIVMPEKLVNKSDSKASRAGLGGVFFMALTLVLVSFSCTGPIVGTVLIKSTSGEFWTPIITMLAFSIAFSLPFTLLALFPSWLKKLPKSGGWLNTFKVVLGFVELALGMKFLQVADQTYHWGLLNREIYLAFWIVIFALLGFYLLGKLRFKYDEPVEHISFFRLVLAILDFTFVVYMIPGMWGAPLKALSGYLPPIQTQDFVIPSTEELQNMLPEAGTYSMNAGAVSTTADSSSAYYPVKYADKLKLPHSLKGYFDLKQAKAYAKHVGKPIFLDFTGIGCMNCREMESRVFSDSRVMKHLRNDYVVCALYCDDKSKLEEEDWITTENGKVLKTMGKVNSYYALKTYGVNAQPYYVLLGRDGKVLTAPRAYGLDVNEFVAFLERGLAEYKKQ
jgi:thiol:disulfide interchange protein DsbD